MQGLPQSKKGGKKMLITKRQPSGIAVRERADDLNLNIQNRFSDNRDEVEGAEIR